MDFFVIEGNIGAGKTSLASTLATKHKAKIVQEKFANNPFLAKFYQEPQKYAFPLELTFLTDRYAQLKNELSPDIFSPFLISDYYFTKSLIFARKTLADDEYTLYHRIFDIIIGQLPKPTLYVYLHRPVRELLKNIEKRGRAYEVGITAEYLTEIEQSYFDYIRSQQPFPILVVDCTGIDFLQHQDYLEKIEQKILGQKYPAGVHYFTHQ